MVIMQEFLRSSYLTLTPRFYLCDHLLLVSNVAIDKFQISSHTKLLSRTDEMGSKWHSGGCTRTYILKLGQLDVPFSWLSNKICPMEAATIQDNLGERRFFFLFLIVLFCSRFAR